jgi:NAD(P)-dependent dehydrogenase (short-subunit alcohol dehydrogenase family)
VRVDHSDARQVEQLFARVWEEQGRLDLLVNDIWGDELTEWGVPFWELDLDRGVRLLRRAIDTHILQPVLQPRCWWRSAADVVEDHGWGQPALSRQFFLRPGQGDGDPHGLCAGEELKSCQVTALAVTPGFLRSEAMLDHFGVTEANWQEGAARDPHFIASETPCFVGRAVAALAADPAVAAKNGGVYSSWGLSDEYGFSDIDGRRSHWGRYFASHVEPELGEAVDR